MINNNLERMDGRTDTTSYRDVYLCSRIKKEASKKVILISPCPRFVHGQKSFENSRKCVTWSMVPNTLEIFLFVLVQLKVILNLLKDFETRLEIFKV